jgi:hypothetical protein
VHDLAVALGMSVAVANPAHEAWRLTARQFVNAPARVAVVAFLYGREYGKWEAGANDEIELPNREILQAELASHTNLQERLDDLR